MLLYISDRVPHWTAEGNKTEGTAQKKERLEKEILAPNRWRCSTIFQSNWCENLIQGSQNGEDHQGAVVVVWRKVEKTRFIRWQAAERFLSHLFPLSITDVRTDEGRRKHPISFQPFCFVDVSGNVLVVVGIPICHI